MFLTLLRFEVKDRLWRLSSLAYFILYLSVSYLLAITFAGAFKGASLSFGLSNKVSLNSPIALNNLICLLAYLGMLVTAPIFGQSVNKDFENKFSQILFATPIRKSTYFYVRYLGSTLSTLAILSSIAVGIWLATLMPFVDLSLIGPNHFYFYLSPYLTNVVPNTLIFGAVFLSVITLFKKMAPVYVASITVFTGWMIANILGQDIQNKTLASLLEPFGMAAVSELTRYWSMAEQNSRAIPFSGVLLYNRLIWMAVGLVFLAFSYFTFNPFKLPEKRQKANALEANQKLLRSIIQFEAIRLPRVELRPDSVRVLLGLSLSEFKQAFSNIYFLMILLCGVIYVFSLSGEVGKLYGTETLPVTYSVLELIGGSFSLFAVILTTFYSGELVWKDREQHFGEIVDSKPVSNLYLYLSKFFSLILLQVFLMTVVLVCSVIIQTFKGYHHYEWSVYFKTLFGYGLPRRLLICVLALFMQTLSKNKYVGHSCMIFYYLLIAFLPTFGFSHTLYLMNDLPVALYSDLNGFGTSLYKFLIVGTYWSFFALGLGTATVLFWRRGVIHSLSASFHEFGRRLQKSHRVLFVISGLGFLGFGCFIFYNTNILNPYLNSNEMELRQVEYEKAYKKYADAPIPDVTQVRLQVDLYPKTQAMNAHGWVTYQNLTNAPITRFLMQSEPHVKLDELNWSKPVKVAEENQKLFLKVLDLVEPLKPREELKLEYRARIEPKGFANGAFEKRVVQNGTFLHDHAFTPELGYQPEVELASDKIRRKYQLPERERIKKIDDKTGLNHAEISNSGSRIDFEATVSTELDQIALAPGYLEKEWTENGRRYFHYKMDRPIWNFYSFVSGRYDVTRDEWKGVKIEVYHHPEHGPEHGVNVPNMIKAAKAGLQYYSQNFSPYQYRQFRIVEFPRYSSYAQSFSNTVPFSEGVGFIAHVKKDDPESVDYPFYITAHELAHQWWGHQEAGAMVQGATMLSESLAEYSALMVQEHEYGPRQMKKFLKYTLDRYLSNRAFESKEEQPLELVENQQYIHYAKGSLVFYALKDYLGEPVVNGVLKEFLKDVAFKGPPYPRSVDLVARFKKVTPPDLQYLITDLFETITFYDNRTESVSFKKDHENYKVTITGSSRKYRTDGQGRETDVPIQDWVDVGLYNQKGDLFYLAKHRLHSGENKIELEVDQEPAKGGIDPLNKLIDRISDDNVAQAKRSDES